MDKTRIVDEQPGFGEDFSTAFGTNLDFIDHTKVGEVVPLKPNEYIKRYSVGKPSMAQGGNMVYEVSGVR